MTSVLRKYSQIEPRSGYFLTQVTPFATWVVDASGSVNSLMSVTDFLANVRNASGTIKSTVIPIRSVLKDLGRQITVYNSAQVGYPHVAIFRQVLYIDQTAIPETEGIGNNVIFYVCVWAQESRGTPFVTSSVVRTG
jgi:hypothetical protein